MSANPPPPSLPNGDSPTLAVVHPTEEEKTYQFEKNAPEWRGALSIPAYLRRERHLASQSLTRDGGLTYWILVDTTATSNPLDPASPLKRLPLASCETYRKRALVCEDGEVKEVVCHGIGSVFCAKELRRRGYAQRLLREVAKELRTWQGTKDAPCRFSVLYSDIGKKFYNDLGWEPFSSAHIAIPAHHLPSAVNPNDLPTARPLYDADIEELCSIDEAQIRVTLASRPADSKTAVALIPDINTIRWYHAREDFVGTELHGKTPEVKGAIVGAEKGKRVWALWTRMWYNENPKDCSSNTLYILRVVIEDEGAASWEGGGGYQGDGNGNVNGHSSSPATGHHDHAAAVAAILSLAQNQAQQWNMQHVMAWNPSSEIVNAARMLDPEAEVVHRDRESIASLMWFGDHEGVAAEKVEWIGNEKFGWC